MGFDHAKPFQLSVLQYRYGYLGTGYRYECIGTRHLVNATVKMDQKIFNKKIFGAASIIYSFKCLIFKICAIWKTVYIIPVLLKKGGTRLFENFRWSVAKRLNNFNLYLYKFPGLIYLTIIILDLKI
jgi:hypothetical protein